MLVVKSVTCEESDRQGLVWVSLSNSDASSVRVLLSPPELRNFRQVQDAVVKQSGLWVHHACESGRSEDRLAWKRLVEQALSRVAACRG
jgi:hypothetical protein